jgi:hypothetical protein
MSKTPLSRRAFALFAVSVTCFSSSAMRVQADHHEGEGWELLFNGKDLSGWKLKQDDEAHRATWTVVSSVQLDPADSGKLVGEGTGGDAGVLFRQPIAHGSDIFTEKKLGDGEFHLEFMVPKNSNSGVYVMGQYEVQILDSFGKPDADLGQGDVGAIYSAAAPSTNAAKEPGAWQTLHIVFQAPRFDADGKKSGNAKFLSVTLNGTEIQKDVEVQGPTGGSLPGGEAAEGPLMIQGDHGIVALKNIRFKPLAK